MECIRLASVKVPFGAQSGLPLESSLRCGMLWLAVGIRKGRGAV